MMKGLSLKKGLVRILRFIAYAAINDGACAIHQLGRKSSQDSTSSTKKDAKAASAAAAAAAAAPPPPPSSAKPKTSSSSSSSGSGFQAPPVANGGQAPAAPQQQPPAANGRFAPTPAPPIVVVSPDASDTRTQPAPAADLGGLVSPPRTNPMSRLRTTPQDTIPMVGKPPRKQRSSRFVVNEKVEIEKLPSFVGACLPPRSSDLVD
jgi:serine/threonine-protein phosphatase 2A regulatory subunit B'